MCSGITPEQASAITAFFIQHLNGLASAVAAVGADKAKAPEGEEPKEEEEKWLKDKELRKTVDELSTDVLALTNGSSSGTKLERKNNGREGRSRSPKRDEQYKCS